MKREVALKKLGNFRGDLSDFKPGGRVTVHKRLYISSKPVLTVEYCVVCPEVTMPRVILMGENDTPG